MGVTPRAPSAISPPAGDEGLRPDPLGHRLAPFPVDSAAISKSLNGFIVGWEGAAQRIFGYRADEVIGRPATILIAHERRWDESIMLDLVRHGQHVGPYKSVRRRKDGALIRVALSMFPSHDASGAIDGVTELVHDLTASRRTRARQEWLLRAERAQRKEADRLRWAKEGLAPTLLHELRTPLQALLSWSEVLQRLPTDHPDFRRGLDAIKRNVREQADVIEKRLGSADSLGAVAL